MAFKDKEYQRQYRQTYREECHARTRRCREKLRLEVLSHYSSGKPECAICGEPDLLVLTIDHIEGGGNQHRKLVAPGAGGKDFYMWLKKNNFPDGLQVLCQNCNTRKYRLEQIIRNMKKMEGK